ncbi:hypothetical protein FT663_04261 [Candidozyma haemuli var. vulneris]|nr:hypothetical protein FT662_03720 [[Candida] haemuloni var. vulneris]KAF3987923.1 hypothetical protein FT663_04261 [[Candida] haemuloni var. vulneris]
MSASVEYISQGGAYAYLLPEYEAETTENRQKSFPGLLKLKHSGIDFWSLASDGLLVAIYFFQLKAIHNRVSYVTNLCSCYRHTYPFCVRASETTMVFILLHLIIGASLYWKLARRTWLSPLNLVSRCFWVIWAVTKVVAVVSLSIWATFGVVRFVVA